MQDMRGYRDEFLSVLKESNNHYGTEIINLVINDIHFDYHRWLHPLQGNWELKELFTEEKLNKCLNLIL